MGKRSMKFRNMSVISPHVVNGKTCLANVSELSSIPPKIVRKP